MRKLDEMRQLVARTRLRIRRDVVYLHRLKDDLVETQCVIERSIKAYTLSNRLLRKMDVFAFPDADHKIIEAMSRHRHAQSVL
jgi:hypothetical protein